MKEAGETYNLASDLVPYSMILRDIEKELVVQLQRAGMGNIFDGKEDFDVRAVREIIDRQFRV